MAENFIEIKGKYETYRFYGLGGWKIKDGNKWNAINGIHIPANVLEVAAARCSPTPPILTERDIAQLCGGR